MEALLLNLGQLTLLISLLKNYHLKKERLLKAKGQKAALIKFLKLRCGAVLDDHQMLMSLHTLAKMRILCVCTNYQVVKKHLQPGLEHYK